MGRSVATWLIAFAGVALAAERCRAQPTIADAETVSRDDQATAERVSAGAVRQPVAANETLPGPAPVGAASQGAPTFVAPIRSAQDSHVEVDADSGLISLSVRDATLRQVLTALAETQDLNLLVAAPADMIVTAEFKKRPLEEILHSLVTSTGHAISRSNGVLLVTSVAAPLGLAPEVQGRRVAVIELDFMSAADMQPVVEGLLSPVGQVNALETNPADNRRTKEVLIVEDLAPNLARIEHHVAAADQAPRQVLIEAHILQIDLEDDQVSGVNYDALARISGAELRLQATGLANATASPAFFIDSDQGDLSGLIQAIISTTDAKTVANPRLMAVSGQQASLQIGEKLGYRLTTTTQTATTESVEFLDVGVVLEITPRVTRDNRVLLTVAPKVSTGAINSQTGVPDEETTELTTSALLRSGQGIVLGGLIQERDDTRINRLPVLGSLPYVNWLFQRRVVEKERSELIVALVPHVTPYDYEQEMRDQAAYARATDPLTYGPLCRAPRPYEPRLFDPYEDLPRCHICDRRDPFCGCEKGYPSTHNRHLHSTFSAHTPRRLPPVAGRATGEHVGYEGDAPGCATIIR